MKRLVIFQVFVISLFCVSVNLSAQNISVTNRVSAASISVTGTIEGGTFSGTLSSGTMNGITSLGTLSNLTVTNNISASTIAGTLSTASQPNITAVGTLTALNVNGTVTATTISGTTINGTIGTAVQPNITTMAALSSVGTINTGVWSATTIQVGKGGTGLTSGTSGGILGFTASGTLASSAELTANALVLGGGAGATPSPLAMGNASEVVAVNAAGTAYEHRLVRAYLPPAWGVTNMAANLNNSQLLINYGPGAQVAAGSRFKVGNAGIITGISVSGSAARTAGTATFTVFKNAVATAVTLVIDGTNTQFNATTGGSVAFVAGDILDVRVTTNGTWAPTTAEWAAWIQVSFTN